MSAFSCLIEGLMVKKRSAFKKEDLQQQYKMIIIPNIEILNQIEVKMKPIICQQTFNLN